MEAKDLVAGIRNRYEGEEHIVLEQVPNGTGGRLGGWIDVAVFSLWPSKGLTRSAFEIKVSRSDFIRELGNPWKNQWVRDSFHEFWFVTPSDVVKDGELPDGVGLMCPRGRKVAIKKHCKRNESPKLDDTLLSAFMRASWKEIEGAKRNSESEVLGRSVAHQRSLLYEKALHVFCESRGLTLFGQEETVDELVEKLEKATIDKTLKQDLDHLLGVSAGFQRRMGDLFSLFAVIAHKSILARDEMSKYVVERFGANDEESIEALKGRGLKFKGDEKFAHILEMIRDWDKERADES